MHPEILLKEKFSEQQIEEMAEEKIKAFYGLLTREVALKLIAQEQGLLKEEAKRYAIKDIPKGGRRLRVIGKITRIHPLKEYASGKRSRTLVLTDNGDSIRFALWNEDTDLLMRLKTGDLVEVEEAYEKNGELHLSYRGKLQMVEAAEFLPLEKVAKSEGPVTVRSVVQEIEGEKTYMRDGGERSFFSFFIGDPKIRCMVWDGMDRARSLEKGDEIILENARPRNGELHVNAASRILIKKQNGGILKEMECEDETVRVRVGERQLTLDREKGLRLLGVEAAPDVALATIVRLKKHALLDRYIVIPSI